MQDVTSPLRRRRPARQRQARAAAVVAAVAVALSAAAWEHGGAAHPVPGRATAATLATRPSAPAPAGRARAASATPEAGLHLISQHVAFRDAAAGHATGPELPPGAGGILVDIDSHAILWERNPHVPHAPASTTKVLSSLVALENFPPDRLVTITPDALHQDPDETVMGLKAGEQLTVRELLSGMLSVSANDAATALAADTVGLPVFVAAMNEQVRALGLSDSTFVTPVGLDDPAQLASPYDLAVIATLAYTHFELFRELVGAHDDSLPATPLHQAYALHNLDQLLDMYPAAVGIKPGYTAGAGGCFIGMAIRNGHRLISVILGGNLVFTESKYLLDWGFVQEGLPPLLPPTPSPRPAATPAPAR